MKLIRSTFIHFLQFIGERYKIKLLPDKIFIELLYFHKMGETLDLTNPHSFTEKIQWLKLYDKKDIYTIMADKYAVKEYVLQKTGANIAIPTIGIFKNFDDVPFNLLPNSFVIKCTHDWNSVIICHNKSDLNLEEVKSKINNALKKNHYYHSLEWAYKNITPQIIIEPFLSNDGVTAPIDYRVYCFNGIPQFIHLTIDKFNNRKALFLDTNWKICNIQRDGLSSYPGLVDKPSQLNIMLEVASKVSSDIPFLRVDFYIVNERLFIGECTFYPAEGFRAFIPSSLNIKIGELIDLPL